MNIPRGPHYLCPATPRRRRQPTVFAHRRKSSAPAIPPQHWNFVGLVNRTKRCHHGPSALAWLGSTGYEVSARKLAACLWRLRAGATSCDTSGLGGGAKHMKGICGPCDGVGLEHHVGNVDTVSPSRCSGRGHSERGKQLLGAWDGI